MILAVAALVIITAIAGTVVQVPFALRLVCALPGEVSSGGVEQLQVCLPRLCMDWRPVFGGIGRPSSGPSRQKSDLPVGQVLRRPRCNGLDEKVTAPRGSPEPGSVVSSPATHECGDRCSQLVGDSVRYPRRAELVAPQNPHAAHPRRPGILGRVADHRWTRSLGSWRDAGGCDLAPLTHRSSRLHDALQASSGTRFHRYQRAGIAPSRRTRPR